MKSESVQTLQLWNRHLDVQRHTMHRYEPRTLPPINFYPDGCRRCALPEDSAVHELYQIQVV